ncbi:hypothetical protein LU298_09795 [Komagataeibacter intermedius]|uniref:Uncharacterized protein n=2 Tax=Komagataeibacter intermedius TaxID=66229 RepID=A0A0N1F9C8_9PROT|nr:hypothetical protein [Komagataeibacter intermedius]KPH87217.1 hypothetical protein GLUCOINTEAF2_0202195 [Komagataeibacter intermedius AF2]MCF3636784.1 hypothetical protein [Komagataeibacter intermedius]GAN87898.1 hypothetical protein Gain_0103_057 [Komagataeibacter intermedius TF2]GBQ66876.1 hypothetical protein AA0521_0855 [Komagataeibacter intermedius NRIC 0521]
MMYHPAQTLEHTGVLAFARRHWWMCMALPVLLCVLGGFAVYLNRDSQSDVNFARHNILMKHSQEEAAYARQLAEYDATIIRDRRVFLDITRAEFARIAPPAQMAWLLQEYRKFDISRVKVYDGHETRPFVPAPCSVPLCFVPIFVEELHDDPVHHTKYIQVGALEDMSRTLIVDAEQFWRLRKLVIHVDAILFADRRQQIADFEKAMQLRASLDVLRMSGQQVH